MIRCVDKATPWRMLLTLANGDYAEYLYDDTYQLTREHIVKPSPDSVLKLLSEAFQMELPADEEGWRVWHEECRQDRQGHILLALEPEDLPAVLSAVLADFVHTHETSADELSELEGVSLEEMKKRAPGMHEEEGAFYEVILTLELDYEPGDRFEELQEYQRGLFSRITVPQAKAIYDWLRLVSTWRGPYLSFHVEDALPYWRERCSGGSDSCSLEPPRG